MLWDCPCPLKEEDSRYGLRAEKTQDSGDEDHDDDFLCTRASRTVACVLYKVLHLIFTMALVSICLVLEMRKLMHEESKMCIQDLHSH